MITKEIKQLIEENPLALATIKNNKPYVIVVAYVKVLSNKIIITDNYMKNTKENIKENPNVALVVWNKDWQGYQINGTAEYFDKGKWLDFVKSLEENKGYPTKGAILVEIKEIKKLA